MLIFPGAWRPYVATATTQPCPLSSLYLNDRTVTSQVVPGFVYLALGHLYEQAAGNPANAQAGLTVDSDQLHLVDSVHVDTGLQLMINVQTSAAVHHIRALFPP